MRDPFVIEIEISRNRSYFLDYFKRIIIIFRVFERCKMKICSPKYKKQKKY